MRILPKTHEEMQKLREENRKLLEEIRKLNELREHDQKIISGYIKENRKNPQNAKCESGNSV